MKHALTLLIFLFLLAGCTREFVQVFETKTLNTQTGEYYSYENDTLKIKYSFWANKGIMAFSIYNKLDKPIYIDWKHSSFVYNDEKLDYWMDEQQRMEREAEFIKYTYIGDDIRVDRKPLPVSGDPVSRPNRNERTTFIPPRSFYYRSQYLLLPVAFFKMDALQVTKTNEPRSDNPKKETIIAEQRFDTTNTPLKFRNFIALKFTESSHDYSFIDNEFYLAAVKEMDARHFRGKYRGMDSRQKPIYDESPLKNNTSFYIEINPLNMDYQPIK